MLRSFGITVYTVSQILNKYVHIIIESDDVC